VRAEISRWPEGTYEAESRTDDDGLKLDVPIKVRCKLTIKGGEASFDFSESDPQSRGFMNAVYPLTFSATLCSVFLFLGTDLSAYHNEGSLRPIHVITREGTVVHAKPGALTAAAPSITGVLIIECVLSVLSKALPQRAISPYGRLSGPGQMIGIDPRTNKLFVFTSFASCGGAGAVYGYDGYQCCCELGTMGVVSKTDAEEEMVRFPWRIRKYEFMTDSPGAGKWRGAPGVWWESVNEGGNCTTIGGGCSGWNVQAEGQQGGYPTSLNKTYILSDDKKIDINNRHIIQEIKNGEILVSQGGGGAGVGRPEEREPKLVQEDVENDLVSLQAAKEIYKVVIDPDTFKINRAATLKLRAKPA
jgi:N-methylhydantoinase B